MGCASLVHIVILIKSRIVKFHPLRGFLTVSVVSKANIQNRGSHMVMACIPARTVLITAMESGFD